LIEDGTIYRVSHISASDDHFRAISPAYYFLSLLKEFNELDVDLYMAYKIIKNYIVDIYHNANGQYKSIINYIIYESFFDNEAKHVVPNNFKNYRVKSVEDLITELAEFSDRYYSILKKIKIKIIGYGANADLKIKEKDNNRFLTNLHIHYGLTIQIEYRYINFHKYFGIVRKGIGLLFTLLHLLSLIRFNFYIHNNITKKRRNLSKFREHIKYFIDLYKDQFMAPIVSVSVYTFDRYIKRYNDKLTYYTPIDKKVEWNWLLPFEITGNIDIYTKNKKLKEFLKGQGFKLSKSYIHIREQKRKIDVYVYRKNIRKKIIIFNKERWEYLKNRSKFNEHSGYIKHKIRKEIKIEILKAKNVDQLIYLLNRKIEEYYKNDVLYGMTFIAKIIKLYNYFVIKDNITDFEEIKMKILQYLKIKKHKKRKLLETTI